MKQGHQPPVSLLQTTTPKETKTYGLSTSKSATVQFTLTPKNPLAISYRNSHPAGASAASPTESITHLFHGRSADEFDELAYRTPSVTIFAVYPVAAGPVCSSMPKRAVTTPLLLRVVLVSKLLNHQEGEITEEMVALSAVGSGSLRE